MNGKSSSRELKRRRAIRPRLALLVAGLVSLVLVTASGGVEAQPTVDDVRAFIDEQEARTARRLQVRPQVFFHLRSEEQRKSADLVAESLRKLRFGDHNVEVPAYRVVSFGPKGTDFRTIKEPYEEDKVAQAIFRALKELVPGIVSRDLSGRFGDSPNVKPKTYELWFAPGEIRLGSRD